MVVLTSEGRASLDNLVAQTVQESKIPGFVFGATTASGELYFKGGGHQVLNDTSTGEVDADSTFWICSQSKLITHLAALQLVERGSLSLEDIVADLLPEFNNPIVLDDITAAEPSFRPAKEPVRIKHLLSFTSGSFYPFKGYRADRLPVQYSVPYRKPDPIGEFFENLKGDLPGVPLKFEPGTNWAYGFGSDIIGFVIERITGLTLEKYLRENIFDPLDMKTSFYLTSELKEKYVALNLRNGESIELLDKNERVYETDPKKVVPFGGVGLYSSSRDYLKLLRHLLQIHAGTSNKPIFTKETVARVFEPTIGEAGQKALEALCGSDPFSPHEGSQWSYTSTVVTAKDWPGRRRAGSAYWLGWANTQHFVDPKTGVAAVFNTQLIPMFDKEVLEYAAKFETALYGGLDG